MVSALVAAASQIIIGLIEALFGRKLFWLFVAIGGFLVGWFVVPAIYGAVNDGATLELWARVVIGLVAGLVLGLLAIRFTKLMVGLAGFFVFGTATVLAVRFFGGDVPSGSSNHWIAFICGGVVGSLLMGLLFNWALIVLTSLFGAGAAAHGIIYFFTPENPTAADPAPAKWIEGTILVVLFVTGLVVQIGTRKRGRSRRAG